nr:ABC transporter permease subunit [uncultured Desulfuromonas sp.]
MLFVYFNLRSLFRDRVFYAVFLTAFFLVALVPMLSSFSMRQVQELSLTLALSGHSLFVVIMGILLGSSVVWRDIETRSIHSVLSLPLTRQKYVLSKFVVLAVFLFVTSCVLSGAVALVVSIAASGYPSEIPVQWGTVLVALVADMLKGVLIAIWALFFSTVATSFYLPFFVSMALFLCGSASQQVYDYILSPSVQLPGFTTSAVKVLYYIVPNFALFDFKVQASYGLPLDMKQFAFAVGYFVLYGGFVLFLSARIFEKREF